MNPDSPKISRRYLDVKELSEYLGLKEGTIRVWICLKKIPYVKVGRLVRFDLDKIDKWIEKNSVEAHPVY
jgi:excisionase family DNA binding protein